MRVLHDDAALADWEGEGGSVGSALRDPVGEPPGHQVEHHGATIRDDQDVSYLGVRWLTLGETADERVASDRMSCTEARGIWDSYLTVERFRSLLRTRDVFREMRCAGEAEP